jgi:hypothetical protein
VFELFDAIAAAWREIAYIGAITGISAGLIVGLIALAWFDPVVRSRAITAAVFAFVLYCGAIFVFHLGAKSVRAQWAAADERAAAQASARDAAIDKKLVADNPPPSAATDTKAKTDEQNALDAVVKAAGGDACKLGAAALRLRSR